MVVERTCYILIGGFGRKLPNTHLRFVPLAGFSDSASAAWGLAAFAFALDLAEPFAAAFAAAKAAALSPLRPRRDGFSGLSVLVSLGIIDLTKSKGRKENSIPDGCTQKSLALLITLEILRVVIMKDTMKLPRPHAAFQAQPIHRPQVDPRPKR